MRAVPAVGFALAVLALALPPGAAAGLRPISGTLSRPGYTVIALTASGKASSVRARTGKFSLVPPARSVTLQLRSPRGKYAGPVVVGQMGSLALVGVRAGARLGRILVKAGYARVAHRLPRGAVDSSRWARARHGVPIGVGVFGLVRSKPPRHPPPGDLDADGIPDVIDIDDNGNLIIDNVDRAKTARAAQAAPEVPPQFVKSFLGLGLWQTANADSPALVGAIPTALPSYGNLIIEIKPGRFVELDCGGSNQTPPRAQGLSYCSRGGTGSVVHNGARMPFPGTFDPDGDGMGNLTPSPSGGSALFLSTGASPTQIGTGDVLVERVTNNGVLSQYTDTVQYVFATVPALVSYSDGQGDASNIQYPVPFGGPGTPENGFPVKAGQSGDVKVTLTFWRPQRTPIPPETAPYTDIGHLTYGLQISTTGLGCPDSAFSSPVPPLTAAPAAYAFQGGALIDQASDQPANPANRLTFTVDLTKCLAAHGRSFGPGQTQSFDLAAMTCGGERCTAAGQSSGPDQALQGLTFTRR